MCVFLFLFIEGTPMKKFKNPFLKQSSPAEREKSNLLQKSPVKQPELSRQVGLILFKINIKLKVQKKKKKN